jgi:probable HAF family extracellular repeat protein
MKRIYMLLAIGCGLLFAASTCFAQMYTLTDLSANGQESYPRAGINARGQEAGIFWYMKNDIPTYHAFRTAPNSPISHPTDDLGSFGGTLSYAIGMNASGQVIGIAQMSDDTFHAFRTAPDSPIDPATDDLGAVGVTAINDAGQVVGCCLPNSHAFRISPNSPINPATDDLGTLGGTYSNATGINNSGQVVGVSTTAGDGEYHLFRTKPNRPINPATDDLGPVYDPYSSAVINAFGQVAGCCLSNNHAFFLPPNGRINSATKDLGPDFQPMAIDSYGEVVGFSDKALLFSGGTLHDLSGLISSQDWVLAFTTGINDSGQISLSAKAPESAYRAAVLNPIYQGLVRPPIKADGSSIFSAKRQSVSVAFLLNKYGTRTCTLPAATIAIVRVTDGRLTTARNAKLSITGCRYAYDLKANRLGVGVYRADISIEGIMVGHAVFALQ